MRGTAGRLQQRGIHIGKVLDLEYPASRVCAVFSKATVHSDTVGLEVFAEQLIAATAVEALATKLGVVGDDAVTDVEALDFGADGGDDTDCFVTGDEGELFIHYC